MGEMGRSQLRGVTILGVSGSIGGNAIAFLRLHRDQFQLRNIAVRSDWETALRICEEFDCEAVSIEDPVAASSFAEHASGKVRLLSGVDGAVVLATFPVDVVLAAISGAAGLPSVLAGIRAGNQVALANKEALVCGGPSLLALAKTMDVAIIPVDSEHSAIFQAMQSGYPGEVESLLLTASGGPFRESTLESMRTAPLSKALAHPNWRMGVKNTIDSATLANKGLELIEAAYLFDCDEKDIDVVINPSSVLHSAVCFHDGSMIAQLGYPDMRTAIGYALSWPFRMTTGVPRLSLTDLVKLEFEAVDTKKFACLPLARAALRHRGDGPLLFNAANEIGVEAFVDGKIGLLDIAELIENCLEKGAGGFFGSLDEMPELSDAAKDFSRFELARLLQRR